MSVFTCSASSVIVILLNFSFRNVTVFDSMPIRATVLVSHWIRFVSWLKVRVVVVCYTIIIP